ncbi:MAG: tyrosine--tRNA ligase [Candidatus Saccharimonadia bacterium]
MTSLKIDELRGVEQIIPLEDFRKLLESKKKLRVKLGVDPSRPDIHLGHTIPLRIMKKFQDAGHTVIFLIGDATGQIGDPSGRNITRPVLTNQEIQANAKTYLDQLSKVLDIKKAEIRFNSEWHGKLDLTGMLKIASHFTVAQLVEREDFKNRLTEGNELALHELFYPVMQAYDSVMLNADIELGGSDQTFNVLAGRSLQKKMGQVPQCVIITKLLVGLDGTNKMSKSLDNYVSLVDTPLDMYGKIMSLRDDLIAPYYELCTEIELSVITELVKTFAEGANPRDAKASLAREIVSIYHGPDQALAAESQWNATFRDKSGPAESQIISITYDHSPLIEYLVSQKLIASRSDVRRLLSQKGIKINNQVVSSEDEILKDGDVLSIGKTRFYLLKG